MDLASASDDLYAGAPDDFVERRKALVTQARAAKDRALATAIGKLRRPTRSAWLVNLYAREASTELTSLLELGAALQAAQEQLSAPDLRRLSAERQQVIGAATGRAVTLGEEHGYTATEAVRQEVSQTLQAALADPAVAEAVAAGVVAEAHAYGGFGVFGTVSPAELSDVPEPGDATATPPSDSSDETARQAAEQRLQDAEAALSSAADEADAADERADELADQVAALRAQLADAEQAESQARTAARAARTTVTERERTVQAARAAYEEALG